MRSARFPAQEVYDKAAAAILSAAPQGEVVVRCEGDPCFYGSFMYLFARLAQTTDVSVVPGVTSLTACAAAARRPLSARSEPVQVLPATLPDQELASAFARPGALAIPKLGRHLTRNRDLLASAGRAEAASYVAHASLPNEVTLPLAKAPATAPYFSMILVPGEDAYASPA